MSQRFSLPLPVRFALRLLYDVSYRERNAVSSGLGALWSAQAGYSSLLAGRSLLPKGERVGAGGAGAEEAELGGDDDYLVLFEGGYKFSYQYTMLIRFTVDTVE